MYSNGWDLPVKLQVSDLEDRHCSKISAALVVKDDTTKNLLIVFSDLVTVNFKSENKTVNLNGRWCLLCRWVIVGHKATERLIMYFRANKETIKEGKRVVFFTGGNLSCWVHICKHYKMYKIDVKPETYLRITTHSLGIYISKWKWIRRLQKGSSWHLMWC